MKLFLPESVLPVSNGKWTLFHYEPQTSPSFFLLTRFVVEGESKSIWKPAKDNLPQTFTADIGKVGESPVNTSIKFLNLSFQKEYNTKSKALLIDSLIGQLWIIT